MERTNECTLEGAIERLHEQTVREKLSNPDTFDCSNSFDQKFYKNVNGHRAAK